MAGSDLFRVPGPERPTSEKITVTAIVVSVIETAIIVFLFVVGYVLGGTLCGPSTSGSVPPPKTMGILVNATYETNDTVPISIVNFGSVVYDGYLDVRVSRLEGSGWTTVWTESPQQTVTASPGRTFATIPYVPTDSGDYDVMVYLKNSRGNVINQSNYTSCRFTVTDG